MSFENTIKDFIRSFGGKQPTKSEFNDEIKKLLKKMFQDTIINRSDNTSETDKIINSFLDNEDLSHSSLTDKFRDMYIDQHNENMKTLDTNPMAWSKSDLEGLREVFDRYSGVKTSTGDDKLNYNPNIIYNPNTTENKEVDFIGGYLPGSISGNPVLDMLGEWWFDSQMTKISNGMTSVWEVLTGQKTGDEYTFDSNTGKLVKKPAPPDTYIPGMTEEEYLVARGGINADAISNLPGSQNFETNETDTIGEPSIPIGFDIDASDPDRGDLRTDTGPDDAEVDSIQYKDDAQIKSIKDVNTSMVFRMIDVFNQNTSISVDELAERYNDLMVFMSDDDVYKLAQDITQGKITIGRTKTSTGSPDTNPEHTATEEGLEEQSKTKIEEEEDEKEEEDEDPEPQPEDKEPEEEGNPLWTDREVDLSTLAPGILRPELIKKHEKIPEWEHVDTKFVTLQELEKNPNWASGIPTYDKQRWRTIKRPNNYPYATKQSIGMRPKYTLEDLQIMRSHMTPQMLGLPTRTIHNYTVDIHA